MISSLKVALLNGPNHTDELEKHFQGIYQVNSLKDLVRLLIEKEVDLVIGASENPQLDKWKKISQTYSVPFVAYQNEIKKSTLNDFFIGTSKDSEELLTLLRQSREMLLRFKYQRQLSTMKLVLDKTSIFTQRVLHTTKDLFITDTKKYFFDNFKMESCHWVAVKPQSSKLPPILKLKQELEDQKVDQGGLIKDLENCASEVAHSEDFQIWKTSTGEYICMIWIHGEDQLSQCVVLNRIQIKKRSDFVEFLLALSPFLQRRWALCLEVAEAQSQVYKDSLTSLYNQKFLNEVVNRKIEEYKRYKTPFSILFIDVDHFKRVNDSLGHVVGSGVLQQLGELLSEQIRTSDFAFRYGGDEFIILLSHTEGEDAVNVAERVRKEVENSRFAVNGLKVRITVSIGLAFFPVHADSAQDIIRIADEAMYYGKHKSRNIVYKAS